MTSPHEQAEFNRMLREEFDYLMKKMNKTNRRDANEKPQRFADSPESR